MRKKKVASLSKIDDKDMSSLTEMKQKVGKLSAEKARLTKERNDALKRAEAAEQRQKVLATKQKVCNCSTEFKNKQADVITKMNLELSQLKMEHSLETQTCKQILERMQKEIQQEDNTSVADLKKDIKHLEDFLSKRHLESEGVSEADNDDGDYHGLSESMDDGESNSNVCQKEGNFGKVSDGRGKDGKDGDVGAGDVSSSSEEKRGKRRSTRSQKSPSQSTNDDSTNDDDEDDGGGDMDVDSSSPGGVMSDSLGDHPCSVCGKRFPDKWSLRKHTTVHTGTRPFKCSLCSRSFKQSAHLKTHTAHLHDPTNPYTCDMCYITFRSETLLDAHVTHEHGDAAVEDNMTPGGKACPVCHKWFTTVSKCKLHLTAVHVDGKPHVCYTCGKSFALVTEFKWHRRRGGECCRDTGRKKTSAVRSKRRGKTRSTGSATGVDENGEEGTAAEGQIPGIFGCQECRKLFSSRKYLIMHQKRVHVLGRPFKCDMCSSAFKDSNALRQHERGVHQVNRKTFSCETCGKGFRRFASLKSHQLSHGDVCEEQSDVEQDDVDQDHVDQDDVDQDVEQDGKEHDDAEQDTGDADGGDV